MLKRIKRAKFATEMLKRINEIYWNNPKLARMQCDSLKKQCVKALDDDIINKEDYDSLIKAVDDMVERKIKGWQVQPFDVYYNQVKDKPTEKGRKEWDTYWKTRK